MWPRTELSCRFTLLFSYAPDTPELTSRIRCMWYLALERILDLTLLGIGSYCLGGCDPRFSYSIESCMPAPQCENRTYTFENISHTLQDYTTYLGDSSQTDWTYSGYPLQYGENVLITMPANSAGTVLMSTKYIWYGSVSATFKTSRDQGVVSAFMYTTTLFHPRHALTYCIVSSQMSKTKSTTSSSERI